MSDQLQNRITSGNSGAGRYTYKVNSEAAIDLPTEDDAAYNRDGSWFFPPRPRSAAQSAAFWENCPVPDEILAQFCRVYSTNWEENLASRRDSGLAEWEANYRANNPAPVGVFKGDAKAKYEEELNSLKYLHESEEIFNDVLRERPRVIYVYDARALARAARMYQFAPPECRDPEEYRKAMECPVDLYEGTLTVEAVEKKYVLSEIVASLDEVFPDTSKQDELIETVDSVRESVDVMNERYLRIIEDMEEAREQKRR